MTENFDSTSIVVHSVVCLVRDDDGRLMLAAITPDGPWSLIGGPLTENEDMIDAATRYALDDCGVVVNVGERLAVLDGPDYQILYECGEGLIYRAEVFAASEVGRGKDAPMMTKWFSSNELHDLYVDEFAVAALCDLGL